MHGVDRLTNGSNPGTSARGRGTLLLWLVLGAFLLTLLGPSACMVRSRTPVLGADSTLVYPSRIANDVTASITFGLRDSRAREEEKERDKERQKAISRLKKDREKLLDLRASQEKEQDRRAQAAAKKAKKEAEKAKKSKSSKKSKKSDSDAKKGGSTKKSAASKKSETAKPEETAAKVVAADKNDDGASKSASSKKVDLFRLSPAAIQDSLARIDDRLRVLMVEDSLAQFVRWKARKAQGLPEDERAFDLEDDARVLATVRLENVHARGKRPLTFHMVWLNPAQKRVFKKIYEYTPNDSTRTLTGSFSIPPSRRTPGFYTLQLFLQRELIATKTFELRGSGSEVPEAGSGDAM